MQDQDLIPHLFRTEHRKMISVLCKRFGMENIQVAEDIVSDTFLLAAESWGLKGMPNNPTAWLYAISKNKAKDVFKHLAVFTNKIAPKLHQDAAENQPLEIDWSLKNIHDSQLTMMFAICHSSISTEAQIGLSLNLLCGFGVDEIADAFLSNRETIYKRLSRAKEKLKAEKVKIELPSGSEINQRLDRVMTTLYLLFSEGYYSTSQNQTLRKELCIEAMRLTLMLIDDPRTDLPAANALLSLMCFHSSRFDARINALGDLILYEEQDEKLWNNELIGKGQYYLNRSSRGSEISKYHLEAAIAYWHTHKKDTMEKWENILQLYDQLLYLEYSPLIALNRFYVRSKVYTLQSPASSQDWTQLIHEAESLDLKENHHYHALMGKLYSGLNISRAIHHYKLAIHLAKTSADKSTLAHKITDLESVNAKNN